MRRAALLQLLLAAAGLLLIPLGAARGEPRPAVPDLKPSYLPAIEGPRDRASRSRRTGSPRWPA